MAVQMHTDTIWLSGPSHTPYSQQPVGVLLASAVTVDDFAYLRGGLVDRIGAKAPW